MWYVEGIIILSYQLPCTITQLPFYHALNPPSTNLATMPRLFAPTNHHFEPRDEAPTTIHISFKSLALALGPLHRYMVFVTRRQQGWKYLRTSPCSRIPCTAAPQLKLQQRTKITKNNFRYSHHKERLRFSFIHK